MEKKKTHKGLKIAGLCLLCVVLALAIAILCLWGHEIQTLLSIKQLAAQDIAHNDGYTYEMHVSGDYYFDDFLAAGGASGDKELIAFITSNITKGIIPMNIEESEIACSSFTATTASGDKIFARNYDLKLTNTCLVYTNPGNGRHASVSTIDLQFIGVENETGITGISDKILALAAPYVPLDGVNDAGLSCGIYMSYQGEETVATAQDTEKPDLTSTTMLRMILDYASTVEEAIALVEQYDLHDSAGTSYHYMVADATGASAVLEWVGETDVTDNDGAARTLRVIRNTDESDLGTSDYQCITNYILAPGYYAEGEDMPGRDRYVHLQTRLEELGGVVADEAEAMQLLSEVGRRTWVTADGRNGTTVHSVVYNLTDATGLWVGNEHYGEDAYTFTCRAAG